MQRQIISSISRSTRRDENIKRILSTSFTRKRMKINVGNFHVDIVSVIYSFIIILPYTQSIHIKLKKNEANKVCV